MTPEIRGPDPSSRSSRRRKKERNGARPFPRLRHRETVGGYVWVYSEVGRGTTFKIYLRASTPPPTSSSRRERRTPLRGTRRFSWPKTIHAPPLAKGLLEKTRVHRHRRENAAIALEAHGGMAARFSCWSRRRHAGASGRELARQLEKTRPATKVLYVSGYTDDAIVPSRDARPGSISCISRSRRRRSLARCVKCGRNMKETGRSPAMLSDDRWFPATAHIVLLAIGGMLTGAVLPVRF